MRTLNNMTLWRKSRKSRSLLTSLSLLSTLLANPVAALSLENIQPIAGFSASCLTAWITPIPGCTVQDFTQGVSCSQSCIKGLTLVNKLVLEACAGADVNQGTLLSDFLEGIGIPILCSNVMSQSTSITSPPPQTQQTTAHSPVPAITTTTEAPTTTRIESTTSISSHHSEATSTLASTLEISISGHTITTSASQTSSTSTSATATSTPGAEDQVFGGVGNAFNIIGNDGSHLQASARHLTGMIVVVVVTILGLIW